MFLNSISMYSIPFIVIILIIIGLSNARGIQLHSKRKKRLSLNNNTKDLPKSYMTIQMNPFSNLDDDKSIPTVTTITLQDDEELMKSDISSSFCENDSIELRLEQDFDYDNDETDK